MRVAEPLLNAEVVELPENRLAVQAVRRLARGGTLLVVIHGPTGTGKTLLVNGLVQQVIRGTMARTVQVLAANELAFSDEEEISVADLVAVDRLVIEDLQQLAVAAMPLLARLLDERTRRRQPTLITANAAPAQLRKLSRRLLSRMNGGLVAAIEPFSTASRKAILRHHVAAKRLAIEPEALDWLAARSTGGSVRPLLGALDSLASQHRGRATPMSLEQIKRALGEETPLGVERIVSRVAQAYGVKPKELLGPSRLRNVLLPRQVAMFLARDVALLSLPRIGAHFGGRDHSTVQHAVSKIRTAMAGDRQLAGTIRQLRLELA